ncbi:MAG: lysophospholipid acyltransferase family protein [Deltaproteobacteria bacterium]|jgi:KDO2-lipid IV(A) lauroyltransferase|nr:lysophospholipid acyltransferase family protein [Deltaproteobacteria bacterium]
MVQMAQTAKKSLAVRIRVLLFLILTWPVSRLPRAWAQALGGLGGRILFSLLRHRRRVTVGNLTRAKELGYLDSSLDIAKTGTETFANLGRTAMEGLNLLHQGVDYFEGQWSILGQSYARQALNTAREQKKGLIFLTAHIGNWELSCQVLPLFFGFKVHIVGRTQGLVADSLLIKLRTMGGHFFIFKDGGAGTMLKILRSGGILGTLFDQSAMVGGEGVPLDFMGRKALTTLAPLKLAAKTGALIIPFFSRRDGSYHYFELFPYLTPPPKADQSWLIQSTQALNDLLADFIMKYPDQWMWGHRRWKNLEGIKNDPRFF